jgi:hypothetical protein
MVDWACVVTCGTRLSIFFKFTTNSLLYWVAASVDTSCSPIGTSLSPVDIHWSPIVSGVALDVEGWWILQLFSHTDIGGFLHSPLEARKCSTSRTPITPRATPADTAGDQKEQYLQRIGTKKYKQGECKTDSDWPESEEDKLECRQRALERWERPY